MNREATRHVKGSIPDDFPLEPLRLERVVPGVVVEVTTLGNSSPSSVVAVMVTFDSARVTRRAIEALNKGTVVPDHIVIVDNGSSDQTYLNAIERDFPSVEVLRLEKNLGFCAANNVGLARMAQGHLLLVNPDAFVSESFLHDALRRLESAPNIGAVGPKLLGADPDTGVPTGLIDSAGIGQTWFGRLFDRGQCEFDVGQHDTADEPVALCAAAILVRRAALNAVAPGAQVFDERFFMYKEDVDLSWRLQRAGWRTVYDPTLVALHCRGWQRDRRSMPSWTRRRSLLNEWRLWAGGWAPGRSRWPALPYLVVKSVAVALGR
jgi:N-acetylglucosaminyl-diphospho-decaprenol L-rhamnosyltransferase